jgi:hypothetical protein
LQVSQQEERKMKISLFITIFSFLKSLLIFFEAEIPAVHLIFNPCSSREGKGRHSSKVAYA